jgi:hypothetical protein
MIWKAMARGHGFGGTGVKIPQTVEKTLGIATERFVTVGETLGIAAKRLVIAGRTIATAEAIDKSAVRTMVTA